MQHAAVRARPPTECLRTIVHRCRHPPTHPGHPPTLYPAATRPTQHPALPLAAHRVVLWRHRRAGKYVSTTQHGWAEGGGGGAQPSGKAVPGAQQAAWEA